MKRMRRKVDEGMEKEGKIKLKKMNKKENKE